MNSKYIQPALIASTVVLSVVFVALLNNQPRAQGEMINTSIKTETLLTSPINNGEALFVLDNNTGRLAAYELNKAKKTLDSIDGADLGKLADKLKNP